MSIIPGIETAAPERTETSSGSSEIAELLAGALLERAQVLLDLLGPSPSGNDLRVAHVLDARGGRDR